MVFNKNYVIRKGSTFSEEIVLSDIYVTLDEGTTYTVTGGMKLVADDSVQYEITGVLSVSNSIITLTVTSADTAAISSIGKFNYAIDIAAGGVVQTILEGEILVKSDLTDIT